MKHWKVKRDKNKEEQTEKKKKVGSNKNGCFIFILSNDKLFAGKARNEAYEINKEKKCVYK